MNPDQKAVPMPKAIAALPVSEQGYPIPWFVKGNDFRVMDEVKAWESMNQRTCWVCGRPNKGKVAFCTGPLSADRGISSEPPCHVECARYAMQVCPFVLYPKSKRRMAGLGDEQQALADNPMVINENPGEFFITITKHYKLTRIDGIQYATYKKRHILSRDHWVGGVKQAGSRV